MIGNPSASAWTRKRYGVARARSCATARSRSDSCLRFSFAISGSPPTRAGVSERHARIGRRSLAVRKSSAAQGCVRKDRDHALCRWHASVRRSATGRSNLQHLGRGGSPASAEQSGSLSTRLSPHGAGIARLAARGGGPPALWQESCRVNARWLPTRRSRRARSTTAQCARRGERTVAARAFRC